MTSEALTQFRYRRSGAGIQWVEHETEEIDGT